MTRVAESVVTNQVRAYDLLRLFARGGRPTPLGQAFAEYRRIVKALHLLSILDPIRDTYRRRLNWLLRRPRDYLVRHRAMG